MLYLDSSALVKLVVVETETPALLDYLRSRPRIPVVTSSLARVELARAARRTGDRQSESVTQVLSSVDQIPISNRLLDEAGRLDPLGLSSLDAIHLASAQRIARALIALVAYDVRLRDAARDAGLPVAAPGASR